jgi:hypothetical protein
MVRTSSRGRTKAACRCQPGCRRSFCFIVMFTSSHRYSTGLAPMDAEWDFRRARRAYLAGRIGRWVRRCRCSNRPRVLGASSILAAGPSRLEVVSLSAIVGTLDLSGGFDSAYRPASDALRRRWEQIALAHRRGVALPPVVLRRQRDGYYVVDGRHRVSVARALRTGDIDAWVTGSQGYPARAWRGRWPGGRFSWTRSRVRGLWSRNRVFPAQRGDTGRGGRWRRVLENPILHPQATNGLQSSR